MAVIKSKGTVLQLEISEVYTAVAGILDLSWGGAKATAFAHDTLDNANAEIPKMETGSTECGEISGNLFFDPVLAVHEALLDLLDTPDVYDWKLIFADDASTEWPFSSAGFGLGLTIALNDGVKAPFSIELAGLPDFPT